MIDTITAYKTNDGKIHESKEKAIAHIEDALQIYVHETIERAIEKDSYGAVDYRALVAIVSEIAGTIDNAREFVKGIFDIVGTFEERKKRGE